MWQSIKDFFSDFLSGPGLNIVKALAVLVVGLIITTLVSGVVRRLTIKNRKLDNAASTFITSLVKIVLYVLVAILVFASAGVNTASLIAAFSAVALAVALGLQDTLSGLVNGILIIFTKPFKQGDYVSIDGTEGTVKEIRLFSTKLVTPDNLDIIVPNSSVLNSNLTNYSAMPLRRIDIEVPVPYSTEVEEIKSILSGCLDRDDRIVNIPAPMCRLKSYGANALIYIVRAWVPNSIFWDVKFDLQENLFNALRANGVEMPVNRTEVNLVSSPRREGTVIASAVSEEENTDE